MEWISVKDRLPDYDGLYLCFIEQVQVCGVFWQYQRVVRNHFNQWQLLDKEVLTHWMQLPEPPKQ